MADQTIIGDGKGLDILSASAVRAALEDCARSFNAATGVGVFVFTHSACAAGVSMAMRAAIIAWPMPQISVHWMSNSPVFAGLN